MKHQGLKTIIWNYILSTKKTLLGQETIQINLFRKLSGSFFIILSVAVLFTDKVTAFGLTESYGYKNPETFIWMVAQSLGPVLFAIGALMRPYKLFYFIPIYIYFIQIYWVFDYTMKVDDPVLHLYATGFSLGVFVFLAIAIFVIKKIAQTNRILVNNIKKSVRHISIFVSEKYINKLPEIDQRDYTIDTVEYIDSLELDD